MKPRLLLPLLLLTAPSAPLAAQNLLPDRLRDLFHEELSGELAKEHVIQITRHHRIQGSRGYRAGAEYVLDRLRAAGFDEKAAWIESFPADGRVVYQTWQSPSGWDIESGELRMIEPREERIVGYPEIAMSVVTYSNPGDVTAELVWVGSGTNESDYEGKDVRGKFVLATGYGGAVHRLAVLKYRAAAVVCYLADGRAKDHPDMLAYTGMWPRTDELERTTFGFNLTNRQGERLRGMLAAGQKVVLHGQVRGTGLEPYFMDVVVSDIPGAEKPDEVLVFSAHLDHPKESANDNASGSGAILDMARSLKTLIAEGRLPRPKRTLRFLWVPEWNGTMAYLDAHPEMAGPDLGGKWLANINMDMVGENEELLHSRMILTRTPASLPSCLNEVVENMARMVDGMTVRTPRGSRSTFNWRVIPYSGGSDHMMFLDRRIPAMMFGHEPDYTHHTSEDTPDKVDPVELERAEIIAASALWYLANLAEEQALDLLPLVEASGAGRIQAAFRLWRRRLAAGLDDPRDALIGVQEVFLANGGALTSVVPFQEGKRVKLALIEAERRQEAV
ncbi:MAG: M28 family peptidase, partial [Planctomycetota bacterium]